MLQWSLVTIYNVKKTKQKKKLHPVVNRQYSPQNDLHFECTWAAQCNRIVHSDMILLPMSPFHVTDSCTIHPGYKCYGAKQGVFLLVRRQGAKTTRKRNERWKALSFLCKLHSHPLLHCKLPVFQLMQIHSLRNDIFLRDASLVLLRSPPSLHLYPHGNPSAQIKPKHLQLHSSHS